MTIEPWQITDVERIIRVVRETYHVNLDPDEAAELWEWYSDEFWCAGWMRIQSDHEIANAALYFARDAGTGLAGVVAIGVALRSKAAGEGGGR